MRRRGRSSTRSSHPHRRHAVKTDHRSVSAFVLGIRVPAPPVDARTGHDCLAVHGGERSLSPTMPGPSTWPPRSSRPVLLAPRSHRTAFEPLAGVTPLRSGHTTWSTRKSEAHGPRSSRFGDVGYVLLCQAPGTTPAAALLPRLAIDRRSIGHVARDTSVPGHRRMSRAPARA